MAQGIGALLKEEREKKGLTLEQMAKTIRLRTQIIEALESEDWNELPAQVFVKGFIRSYTQTLGLDKNTVMSLYEKSVPPVDESPKPLMEAKKRKSLDLFLYYSFWVY